MHYEIEQDSAHSFLLKNKMERFSPEEKKIGVAGCDIPYLCHLLCKQVFVIDFHGSQ